jgi:serine/threonine-protein kinase
MPRTPKRTAEIRVSRETEEGVRFLQERLSLYFLALLVLSAAFLLLAWLAGLTAYGRTWRWELAHPGNRLHFVHMAVFAAGWAISRYAPPSRRLLAILDAASCSPSAASTPRWRTSPGRRASRLRPRGPAHSEPPSETNANLVVLTARAVLVPSTALRTAILSAVSVAPMIAVGLVERHQHPGPATLSFALGTQLWSFLGVALAAIVSKVIYNLQEQVREALQLGQYTLEQKIGEGGRGVVYRARHAMLRRPTAIKLLPPVHTGERDIERFEREVQMTSRLTHPNTISVYDYGRTPEGIFYYAMELLDGADLERVVRVTGPLPPARAIHLLSQVCGALAEAHEIDLIHRDIKPSNVFVCRQGGAHDVAKVLDFGLVRDLQPDSQVNASITTAIVGTPLYLAPEAITAPDKVDARSDLYAVGCMAHFLLTGQPPFTGESFVELGAHHVYTPAPPVSAHATQKIAPALEEMVAACLAKDPAARPQSARALRAALLACVVEPWTEEHARAWWEENGARVIGVAQGAPSSALGRTIAVDRRARN